MKKLFVFMAALAMLTTGCSGGGGGQAKEHTVTFECNYTSQSGKPVQSIVKVKDGEKVSKPTVVRSDYDLDGWFKDNETFKVAFDFNEAIKADLTLYAKWTAKAPETKVNATEWAAATSEAALRNVRIDLTITMAGQAYASGFNEQDDNKCYAEMTMSGEEDSKAYLEKVDSDYYIYEKNQQGAWVKNKDTSGTSGAILPSEQYSTMFATITFSANAYDETEKAYIFSDANQTLTFYFENYQLVKFNSSAMGGMMVQDMSLSKYGEISITLPEVK